MQAIHHVELSVRARLFRVRSELSELEQHRARLSEKLSKQSIFEEFLTQVMSASSEYIDIRSIMSRYHTLKQLYEVISSCVLINELTTTVIRTSAVFTVHQKEFHSFIDYCGKYEPIITTGWAKKVSRKFMFISSPNIDRFSIFFHWQILWKICNRVVGV